MVVALIPVKEFALAKARLAPALDADERRSLALALFRDVLDAALSCGALEAVAVVSRDDDALALAFEAGALPMPEPGGLNASLTSAAASLAQRRVDRLVVLAADLPLVEGGAIASVAETDAQVAVVPSQDGGTNALALSPGAITFRYGPDSARLHLASAEEAGLRSARLSLAALSFDVDTPDDLTRLQKLVEAAPGLAGVNVGARTAELIRSVYTLARSVENE
ncbi:MAG: 2-phospho-L-lactate guanylyltransferase [Dehalococcoidia bacterium]